jgi:hypothetical protein
VIFDTPHPDKRQLAYRDRYDFLKLLIPKRHPYAILADYIVCHDRVDIENVSLLFLFYAAYSSMTTGKYYFSVRQTEGEGVILRDPSAPYISGYSHHIYKHRVPHSLLNNALYFIIFLVDNLFVAEPKTLIFRDI